MRSWTTSSAVLTSGRTHTHTVGVTLVQPVCPHPLPWPVTSPTEPPCPSLSLSLSLHSHSETFHHNLHYQYNNHGTNMFKYIRLHTKWFWRPRASCTLFCFAENKQCSLTQILAASIIGFTFNIIIVTTASSLLPGWECAPPRHR